jgi:hypothetical protein
MAPILTIHPRVFERHPELKEDDLRHAWDNSIVSFPRISKNPNEYIAIGCDLNGRLVEMITIRSIEGDWLMYHALTPPTKKFLDEMGMI